MSGPFNSPSNDRDKRLSQGPPAMGKPGDFTQRKTVGDCPIGPCRAISGPAILSLEQLYDYAVAIWPNHERTHVPRSERIDPQHQLNGDFATDPQLWRFNRANYAVVTT